MTSIRDPGEVQFIKKAKLLFLKIIGGTAGLIALATLLTYIIIHCGKSILNFVKWLFVSIFHSIVWIFTGLWDIIVWTITGIAKFIWCSLKLIFFAKGIPASTIITGILFYWDNKMLYTVNPKCTEWNNWKLGWTEVGFFTWDLFIVFGWRLVAINTCWLTLLIPAVMGKIIYIACYLDKKSNGGIKHDESDGEEEPKPKKPRKPRKSTGKRGKSSKSKTKRSTSSRTKPKL